MKPGDEDEFSLAAILFSSRETLHKTLFIKFTDYSQLKENNLAKVCNPQCASKSFYAQN